jgi:hypothetical protein
VGEGVWVGWVGEGVGARSTSGATFSNDPQTVTDHINADMMKLAMIVGLLAALAVTSAAPTKAPVGRCIGTSSSL